MLRRNPPTTTSSYLAEGKAGLDFHASIDVTSLPLVSVVSTMLQAQVLTPCSFFLFVKFIGTF